MGKVLSGELSFTGAGLVSSLLGEDISLKVDSALLQNFFTVKFYPFWKGFVTRASE